MADILQPLLPAPGVTPFLIGDGDPTATLSIQKVASTHDVLPGQVFSYTVQFQCTAGIVNGCVNASFTDTLPSFLTIQGEPTITGAPSFSLEGTTDTQLVITFTDDLGQDQIGLAPGQVVVVQFQVRVDDDPPGTADGETLSNIASITADNAVERDGAADVTLTVPPSVDATTTKQITPNGGNNDTSDLITSTLTGTNASNVPVSEMVISDPVLDGEGDPAADMSGFDRLAVGGLAGVTPPDGAETVQVRVFDATQGAWVDGPVITLPGDAELPDGVDPADIRGLQFIFTSEAGIPAGAAATIDLQLHLREVIPEAELPILIVNTADTTVTAPDGTSVTSPPASASYRVPPATFDMSATKSFSPSVVRVGDSTTATITGTNASDDPIDSMTIIEPAASTTNHFADGSWTFTGLGAGIAWPTGATAATITYLCDGVPSDPQPAAAPNTLPGPPADCDPVTGFTARFTGSMTPGATATIPFDLVTNVEQDDEEQTLYNTVGVEATSGNNTGGATATAGITTIRDRIRVDVGKSIVPSTIPSYPGQIVTALLSGQVLPFPDSTVDATTVIVQDPDDFDTDEWYDSFDPRSVTATPVPGCATLTVEYTSDAGGSWTAIPGMAAIAGATIFNGVIPDEIGAAADGIRFVFTADPAGAACTGGFPPGTSFSPNLVFSLDPAAGFVEEPTTLTDCAGSSASAPTADEATAGPACDDVTLTPVDGGAVDPIDKSWDLASVPERSQSEAGATISWSTQGFTGIGRVDITDPADPDTTPIAQSVFDTWDLLRIDPITPAMDPLLTYDQIARVQLYQLPAGSTDPGDGQWVDAPGDPCPAACDGTFPGYTLSAADRAVTIGFRLMYIESPTREERIDGPTAPPVGTGVAASTGNNRSLRPVFELRDDRRSDPTVPVVAGEIYNTADPGIVNNTVRLDPFWHADDETPILSYTDADTILITNVDVHTQATKVWEGGPKGIPEAGVPQSDYPTSRITVTGANLSPSKLDRLVIAEPDTSDQGPLSCQTNPLDVFNVIGFTIITPPGDIGADDVTVTLTLADGASAVLSREAALALTEPQLVDVVGTVVTYSGRIDAATTTVNPTATLQMDVRLRTADRVTGLPPEPGTVCNQVRVDAADMVDFPGFTDSQSDYQQAGLDLVAQGIAVVASKSIDPSTVTEPSHGPVNVTLGGQPSGPSRTVRMVLEDTSTLFFNQYDFAGFQPVTWVTPVDQVRADVFTGGTWSLVDGAPVLTGGAWVEGAVVTAPATTLSLPAGVTADQVQGVRFTFTRADGANWENPATPLQTGVFAATLRDTLNTGGPVPSTLAGSTPAPGETVAGTATDTTTATATSSDTDADGIPLTASDSTTATVVYQHAFNAVQLRKAPDDGTAVPGSPFRYTITATNTGAVDITNPQIIDVFPTDADGPQVELLTDPQYAFTMTGGTGMPTDASQVTITESAAGLTFAFPAGSTLPIGATYTIAFTVVTRPGLAATIRFTNQVGIVGDRQWDGCDGGPGGGLDADTGECRTVATNTVTAAGAVTVQKQVRAEGSDVLGTTIDPLWARVRPASCTPLADGFYRRPCVPIAEPGGDITWRLRFLNSGNLPLDRILGIDRLPAPGDAVSTSPTLPRLSDWRPLLSGVRPTLSNGAGTFNVFYTTGTAWCDGPQAADGALLCPALNWQAWPEGATLPTDPALVTGIQVEYLPDVPLAPAASYDVDLPMLAPAQSPAATPNTTGMSNTDTFAFNTIGEAARVVTAGSPYTLTTEPPRVGVALANGGLRVVKHVDGPAAGFAPGTFTVGLSCVSAGEEIALPEDVAALTLTPDEEVTVYDLPYGATCTLQEGDNGQTTSSAVSAIAEREPEDFALAELTNTYELASLTIVKRVESDAVDEGDTPIGYGPFAVTVACTFLGEPVFAEGFSADDPMAAVLADGGTITLTGLPAGAECTVTETDAAGAASVNIVVTAGSADPETTDGTSATVELSPDVDGESDNSAVVTNVFAVGSISVQKVVDGEVGDVYGAGPFVVRIVCTLADGDEPRTVWDGEVTLGGDGPLVQVIDDVAAGASCTAAETDDGGATSVAISPEEGFDVESGATATVTVTNTFDPAEVLVEKAVEGEAASFAPDVFLVEVTCSTEGGVLPGFPVVVEVGPGAPATVPTLAGSTCTAVEVDSGQATTVSYDPVPEGEETAGSGPVVPLEDEPATISVTNAYDPGALQIVKTIEGTGAADARGPFAFSVVCAFNGDDEAFSDTVTLQRAGAATTIRSGRIAPLPVGAICTVTETGDGGADFTPPPVTVTIESEAVMPVVLARFANTFTAPLPATGSDQPVVGIAIGGGLLVLAGLFVVVRRRRRTA